MQRVCAAVISAISSTRTLRSGRTEL